MTLFNNRKAWRYLALYTVLIFFSGLLIGMIGYRAYWDRPRGEHDYGRSHRPHHVFNKLSATLDLTEAQKESLQGISDSHYLAMKTLRKKMRQEVKLLKQTHMDDIAAILTAEQKKKFFNMREKYDKKHERYQRHSQGKPHKKRSPKREGVN